SVHNDIFNHIKGSGVLGFRDFQPHKNPSNPLYYNTVRKGTQYFRHDFDTKNKKKPYFTRLSEDVLSIQLSKTRAEHLAKQQVAAAQTK
ncbi:MAG: hypothetical protein QM371_02100, partial [Bacillota bacterium]|nr:hypothetical protein [Bacillota bacterium]